MIHIDNQDCYRAIYVPLSNSGNWGKIQNWLDNCARDATYDVKAFGLEQVAVAKFSQRDWENFTVDMLV